MFTQQLNSEKAVLLHETCTVVEKIDLGPMHQDLGNGIDTY